MQAEGVNGFVRGAGDADGGDAAVQHADIGRGFAPGQHRRAAADQQVVVRHYSSGSVVNISG